MPKVRVNGIGMFYEGAGRGEPLILIMGIGGDHLAWAFQARAFAAHYRVVTFDNRGAGQTDAPEPPYTIRTMADDTAGLMDALGLPSAHIVGVSMGGMIAQELALAYPARVRSLHLACTTARPDAHMKALLAAWRDMRSVLTKEAMVRATMLWLFSYRTYDERPEFVETVIQTALANPFPQSLTGFLGQAAAVQGHVTTRWRVSPMSPARRSEARRRPPSPSRRDSLASWLRASRAPPSAPSSVPATSISGSRRTPLTRSVWTSWRGRSLLLERDRVALSLHASVHRVTVDPLRRHDHDGGAPRGLLAADTEVMIDLDGAGARRFVDPLAP